MIHLVKFMVKKIFVLIKPIILILLFITNLYAEEITIIPLKKPILDKKTIEKKLAQGILKPKSKPIKEIKKEDLSKEIIKPRTKPIKEDKTKIVSEPKPKKNEEIIIKITKKKLEKNIFLTPKNKPLVVKKTSTVVKKKSKYYSQKDYDIAKKAIQAIEKRKWTSALTL